MKAQLKRLWGYIEGWNGLSLILYLTFIFSTQAFFVNGISPYLVRWVLLILTMSVILGPMLLRWVRRTDFCPRAETASETGKREWGRKACFFGIPFLVFLLKYLVYYPGSFTPDSMNQYQQFVSGVYNDWHPVAQTLLSFGVPLTLSGGWFGSIILVQVIVFAFAIGYMLETIHAYSSGKYAWMVLALIVLNPNVSNIAIAPWKDTAFAMGTVLLISFGLRVFFTGGEWIRRPVRAVCFVLVLAATTLVRHNAVLFTAPLAMAVFVSMGPKRLVRSAVLAICSVLVVVGVRGPLYSALKVEAPGERQIETLGMPMVVIGAVAKYAPENLDAETKEFVDRIAPPNVWDFYVYGNYNNVKWYGANNQVIEEYGAPRVISMALRCLVRSPNEAIRGLIRLTDVVYSVCDDYRHADLPMVPNVDGLRFHGVPALQKVNELWTHGANTVLPWFFMYIGMMHLVLIVLILAKRRFRLWADWKRIFYVLPVFAYNFGTTLLLTDAHDSSRFFLYTFLVTPALVVLLCNCSRENRE